MEFDKNNIYTALSADQLKIGSKCIFEDTIHDLRKMVQSIYSDSYISLLAVVKNDSYINRFEADNGASYSLAYLIEPFVKKPKYRPFESVEELVKAAKKHDEYVQHKCTKYEGLLIGTTFDKKIIARTGLGLSYISLKGLFKGYVFADDGTPCGKLVEE